MTDWRAVLTGFVVQVAVGVLGAPLGFGPLVAGLFGGFVAGWIVGGGLARGAWHGLLAGSLGGLVVALLLWFLVTVVGVVGLGFGGLPGVGIGVGVGVGVLVLAVAGALVAGVESAFAGALASVLAS
jgi:hypothetical protein